MAGCKGAKKLLAINNDPEAPILAGADYAVYEVLPVDGIEDLVIAHVPREVKVTVTASPSRGLEATLSVTEHLAAEGYHVVPHLSARLVRDVAHLDEIIARLEPIGVREAFVPAGDATEPGDFPDAASLLRALAGRHLHRSRHHGLPREPPLHQRRDDDPGDVREGAAGDPHREPDLLRPGDDRGVGRERARSTGTTLPIWIGVPGVVDHARLLRISMRIGLGESTRFLLQQHGWVRRLLARRFSADELVRDLAPTVADPLANVAGLHFYTFNEVQRMERWRRRALDRLDRLAVSRRRGSRPRSPRPAARRRWRARQRGISLRGDAGVDRAQRLWLTTSTLCPSGSSTNAP